MERNAAETYYSQAVALDKAGKREEAIELFKKSGELFQTQGEKTQSYKAYYNAGISFYKLGEMVRALQNLKACLHAERKFIPAHLLIAQIYQWDGNEEKTEIYLQNVLKIEPTHKSALGGLAMFYYEKNRFNESLQMLDKYLTIYPNNPHLKILKTEVLAKQGNFKQSATMLKEMVTQDQGFIGFNQSIEKAWQEEDSIARKSFKQIQNKAKKKLKEFKTKLSLAEENPENFSPPEPQEALDLSLLYLFNGDPEKAVQYLVYAQKLKESEKS